MPRRIYYALTTLVILLSACAGEADGPSTPAPTATTRPLAAQPEATIATSPASTAAPIPTVAPTPIAPAIEVSDKMIGDDGRIFVDSVATNEPSWLVIYAQDGGQLGEVLGYTAVGVGVTHEVVVTIDPFQASETLTAMLHADDGEKGLFEFPETDEPLGGESAAIAADFNVEFTFALPSISIADQELGDDRLLRVEGVYSPVPAWLLIRRDEAGSAGAVIGFVHVEAGFNSELAVPLQPRRGTPRLYAMLHEDSGRLHMLDEAEDLPLLVGGEPVAATVDVVLPRDIFALDQPVVDGRITFERVVTEQPSWLVIYFEEEGELGRIIGFVPLEPGLHEQFSVDVVERAVTPVLYVLLHEDTVVGDEFDFPAVDHALTVDGRLPVPYTFRTDAADYVITRDQVVRAAEGRAVATVTIPLAVVNAPLWLVVQASEEGEAAAILGYARLEAGINRDVEIEVDAGRVTETLFATLHRDAGEPGEFEFPDGEDEPVRSGEEFARSPFLILPES